MHGIMHEMYVNNNPVNNESFWMWILCTIIFLLWLIIPVFVGELMHKTGKRVEKKENNNKFMLKLGEVLREGSNFRVFLLGFHFFFGGWILLFFAIWVIKLF